MLLNEGVDVSNLSGGLQLLYEMVSSKDNYLYSAGTSGEVAASLFVGSDSVKTRLRNSFTCSGYATGCGTLVGTLGRPNANQPANLSNGDPVFAVIAYNTQVVITQVGLDPRSGWPVTTAVDAAQSAGLNQLVAPVSFFIHESAENLSFSRQPFVGTPLRGRIHVW